MSEPKSMLKAFEAMMQSIGAAQEEAQGILLRFITDAHAHQQAIAKALTTNNPTQVEAHAHALKGSAGNLRLTSIEQLAQTLLIASQQGCLSDTAGVVTQLHTTLVALQAHTSQG